MDTSRFIGNGLMHIEVRHAVVQIVVVLIVAGCGGKPTSGLSGLVYGKADVAEAPPISEEFAKRLSERLECGSICDRN